MVYRHCRHVTVSEATRRELATLGIPAGDIELVFNGSDETSIAPAKAPHPTVISLGRLVPHKRVEIVLHAAAQLRRDLPDLRVIVVGRGPWASRLETMAGRLGLADVVTFCGWVDEATKQDLLCSAWVLAMPSVKEGWGLAVMEAAVFRTPAVAFRVGGLEESIVDGRSGLLADDVPGFVGALRTVLADSALRWRMGEEAAGRAAGYSWDDTTLRFAAILREAVVPVSIPVLEPVPAVDP
jgi:glycosyltransferase involved in cell wall biosynthesis